MEKEEEKKRDGQREGENVGQIIISLLHTETSVLLDAHKSTTIKKLFHLWHAGRLLLPASDSNQHQDKNANKCALSFTENLII